MKDKLLICIALLFFTTSVFAQFPTSDKLYLYKKVKEVKDEVSYKPEKITYYAVVFLNQHIELIMIDENLSYWTGENRLHLYETSEQGLYHWLTSKFQGRMEAWNNKRNAKLAMGNIHTYSAEFSTLSKYTYRVQHAAYMKDTPTQFPGIYGSNPTFFDNLVWDKWCHSFSTDRTEMIFWSTDPKYTKRDYYELIKWNDILPNLDFLE